jgi:hypothetical protein
MIFIIACDAHGCDESAVVCNGYAPTPYLCWTHAQDVRCECGHTAAACPIAGCGDWQPLDEAGATLLSFEFTRQNDPRIRLH